MSTITAVQKTPTRSKPRAIYLSAMGLFVFLSIFSWIGLAHSALSGRLASHDFISYWAAGKQLIEHRNPYEANAIQSLEAAAGRDRDARVMMMRNGPNALFLALPIALMPPRIAAICWFLVLVGCLAVAVELLARRSTAKRVYGYCFAPSLACLATGQIGIFCLLGIAVFLHFKERRPWIAGVALALCLTKPHLIIPLTAVVVIWACQQRRYALLGGTLVALVTFSFLPVYFDHAVWADYAQMIRADGIETEFVPALGSALRAVLKLRSVWPQLLPAAIASAWSVWYFFRHRADWSWEQRMPLLVLVSLAVAPYAWFTDQAIVFVAIALAGNEADPTMLALMGAAYIEFLLGVPAHSPVYLCQSIAWLTWYALVHKSIIRTAAQ